MDRTHDEGLKVSSNRTGPLLPRASLENSHSPRLQKKRSVKRVRSDARRLTTRSGDARPAPSLETSDEQLSSQPDDIARQKSHTLRDTVRKLFGRRSRAADGLTPAPVTASPLASTPLQPSSIQSTPIKHKAHRSEPPDVARNTELPPRPNTADRAASASLHRESPTASQRLRSPNAVEFPRSRQLKPLVLPAPFEDPRATLRRRKTLPSILIPEQDAKEIAAAIASAGPYPAASTFELDLPAPVEGLAAESSKTARRRSRSAGDLREQALQAGPVRKRSDEIRFWRESIHNTVLRASGFSNPPDELDPSVDSAVAAFTPPRQRKDYSPPASMNRRSLLVGPHFDAHSASAYGTEISRDLEDRVAKLEANLNFFQRSLQKLQTDRSRRAGLAGLQPRARRDSHEDRSPSMLVDDLQVPFTGTPYRYDVDPGPRPSTAPSRPSRPSRPARVDADAPPVPQLAQPESPPPPIPPLQPTRMPPPRPARPNEPAEDSSTPQPLSENATFRSLYRMLTDERSARRQLETQVRYMRTEISDLQQQVTQPQMQSQRSSYLFSASSEAGAGSARLRNLLGQLEGPTSQYHTPPPRGSAVTEAVVSRFSGSTRQESEAGAAREDVDDRSIYDNERTPRPDHGQHFQLGEQDMDFSALDGPYVSEHRTHGRSAFHQQQQEEDGEMF